MLKYLRNYFLNSVTLILTSFSLPFTGKPWFTPNFTTIPTWFKPLTTPITKLFGSRIKPIIEPELDIPVFATARVFRLHILVFGTMALLILGLAVLVAPVTKPAEKTSNG